MKNSFFGNFNNKNQENTPLDKKESNRKFNKFNYNFDYDRDFFYSDEDRETTPSDQKESNRKFNKFNYDFDYDQKDFVYSNEDEKTPTPSEKKEFNRKFNKFDYDFDFKKKDIIDPEPDGEVPDGEKPPSDLPVVSLTTEPELLIESENTVANIDLSLDAPPPAEGVTVTVLADEILEFELGSIEVSGGEIVVPPVASDLFGFTVNLTEQDATVSLTVQDDGRIEGSEEVIFTLEEPTFNETYQVDPLADSGTFTIIDTPEDLNPEPPNEDLPAVSLSVEPGVLFESEHTVANININLDTPPPEEGVTVTVLAPDILEFDLDSIEVSGGEIVVPPVASDLFGFTVNLTEQNATVSLAVADDGIDEGLEQVDFRLEEPTFEPTYRVAPLTNIDTVTIFDTNGIDDAEILGIGDRSIAGGDDSLLMGEDGNQIAEVFPSENMMSPEFTPVNMMSGDPIGVSELDTVFDELGMMQSEDDILIAASDMY